MEEKCSELMLMKFGRIVDLEALQTLSVNTNLEELKMKMMEKEQVHADELKKWEVRLETIRQCRLVRGRSTGGSCIWSSHGNVP